MTEQDWAIRTFIFHHFARNASPPTLDAIRKHFAISHEETRSALQRLHEGHTLYLDGSLDPVTGGVRIANPFSAIPTAFRVHTRGQSYYANCAWDSLGVPAALHEDATIEAVCAESGVPIQLMIANGILTGDHALVHFPLPFLLI